MVEAQTKDFFEDEKGFRKNGRAIEMFVPSENSFLLIIVESPLFPTTEPVRAFFLETDPHLATPAEGFRSWSQFNTGEYKEMYEAALEYARARRKMLKLTEQWIKLAL